MKSLEVLPKVKCVYAEEGLQWSGFAEVEEGLV